MSVIRRNLLWLLVSQFATWGVSILLLLLAPRRLGDASFGQLSFAMVYVSFFELLAIFGTATFLMKTIARDTESLGTYVWNSLVMKSITTGLLVGAALALAVVLGYDQQTILLIGAFCVGMVFNALNNVLIGGFQGRQQMGRLAVGDIARSYVGGALGIAVLLTSDSLVLYALVLNLACAIPLIVNAVHLRGELLRHRGVDLGLWRRVLIGGFPFFVWSALLVFYGTIDIPLLESFAGSETVGWYALAYRWVSMPVFFAASVATAFLPAMSAHSTTLPETMARMANRALYLVVVFALPAAAGIALIADSFIATFYGAGYQESVPLMRILALHIPIAGVDIVLGSAVVAADRQRRWLIVGVVAAVVNPLLNLVAIPWSQQMFDNGAIGASIVTVMTELVLMVGAIILRPPGVLDRSTVRIMGRIGLATAAMVPVVLVLHATPMVVQVAAGAVAYGLASLALGTVPVDELRGFLNRRRQAPSISA